MAGDTAVVLSHVGELRISSPLLRSPGLPRRARKVSVQWITMENERPSGNTRSSHFTYLM